MGLVNKGKGMGVFEDYGKPYGNTYKEELTEMTFSVGNVLSQNKGKDVSLNDLSVDTQSFTGKNEGFYMQNKAMVKKLAGSDGDKR